jgi:hypothetical protein
MYIIIIYAKNNRTTSGFIRVAAATNDCVLLFYAYYSVFFFSAHDMHNIIYRICTYVCVCVCVCVWYEVCMARLIHRGNLYYFRALICCTCECAIYIYTTPPDIRDLYHQIKMCNNVKRKYNMTNLKLFLSSIPDKYGYTLFLRQTNIIMERHRYRVKVNV